MKIITSLLAVAVLLGGMDTRCCPSPSHKSPDALRGRMPAGGSAHLTVRQLSQMRGRLAPSHSHLHPGGRGDRNGAE